MKTFRGILILSLLLTVSNADNNQSTQNESSYVDEMHKFLSDKVLEWSELIDTTVSHWMEDNETNTTDFEPNTTDIEGNITILERNITDIDGNNITILERNITDAEDNITIIDTNTTAVKTNRTIVPTRTRSVKTHTTIVQNNTVVDETNKPTNTLEEKVHSVDQFFQNEKYLNETKNTYIRVRGESYLQSKESNDFDLTIRAQMPFSKTKKRFRIFVDDLTLDNADEILRDTSKEEDDDVTPDIGIHYFASRHEILSRYSIGLSGIDPFVKARYNMPINVEEWLIDPVQLFRYSTDDKLEEETNIYFDRKVGEKSLLRIQLHRSTQEENDGMNYALSAQYYRSTKKGTGFGFGQTFFGNTEYEYTTEKGVPNPKTKKYGGIHDYVTSFTWRANIWRKWFYYEVRPSVSFHKQYDYEPNYRVRFFLDFYFGQHH
jgi:hypothetical protein